MDVLSVLPFYEHALQDHVVEQECQCVLISMIQASDSGIDSESDSISNSDEFQTGIPTPPPPPPLPSHVKYNSCHSDVTPSIPIPPPLPPLPSYFKNTSCHGDTKTAIPTPPPLPPLPGWHQTLANIPTPPPPPPVQFHLDVFVRSHSIPVGTTPTPMNRPTTDCEICYLPVTTLHKLDCCSHDVCEECIQTMITTNIDEGVIRMSCPFPDCGRNIPVSVVSNILRTEPEYLKKFDRFRNAQLANDTEKVCPNCSLLTHHEVPKRILGHKAADVKITCQGCTFEWCFKCHAPWHKDQTCKEHKKGSKDFKQWLKSRNNKGAANGQKCPSCNIPIQRSTGCDHMTCSKCSTHFCYHCGRKHTSVPGLGGHYDGLSVFGCTKYYDGPQKTREAVRYGYVVSKLSAGFAYPAFYIAGIGIIAVGAAVVLPVYGCYRLHKRAKRTRQQRRRRAAARNNPIPPPPQLQRFDSELSLPSDMEDILGLNIQVNEQWPEDLEYMRRDHVVV